MPAAILPFNALEARRPTSITIEVTCPGSTQKTYLANGCTLRPIDAVTGEPLAHNFTLDGMTLTFTGGVVTETKNYADGSSATGPAPLPDLSPAEQAALPCGCS